MKKFLAALLAASVCLTCLPMQVAFAEEGAANTEETTPIELVDLENQEETPPASQDETAPDSLAPLQDDFGTDRIDGADWPNPGHGDYQREFNIDRSNGLDQAELYNYRGDRENVMLPYVYEKVGDAEPAYVSIVKVRSNSFNAENASFVKRVTIPDSVETIESGAFIGSGLEAIWIPESVTEIGSGAFPKDTKIYGRAGSSAETYARENGFTFEAVREDLDIRNGTLMDIKDEFQDDTLVIPEIVFQLAGGITHNYGQYTITSLVLPVSFGDDYRYYSIRNEFLWCLNTLGALKNIFIDENNPNLTVINDCIFSKDGKKFWFYPSGKTESEYAIPEGTEVVDGVGLWLAANLTKLIIPASVTELRTVKGENLEEIVVDKKNEVYASQDGVLYGPCEIWDANLNKNISGYGILLYPAKKYGETFSVPDSVNNQTVTIVGSKTFFRQEHLREIILSDNIIGAGNQPFIYCQRLQKITIPKSMTIFDDTNPFTGCKNLTNINVDAENPVYQSIDGVMFSKDGTRLVTYPSGRNEFLSIYHVPQGVTTIGDCAFAENRSIQAIYLPEGVTMIEGSAFVGCASLKYIYLPDTLEEIGDAFRYCSSLRGIELPKSGALKKVSRALFQGCDRLLVVQIPDSVDEITFRGGNSVGQHVFPDNTIVIASKDSIMWRDDPANPGRKYGGPHLIAPEDLLRGDLNGDKEISMADMELLMDYLREANPDIAPQSADANGDGKVDSDDFAYLKEALTEGFAGQ